MGRCVLTRSEERFSRNVYVDMGFIPPEMHGLDYYRWLYTATTRATRRIFYVNPEGVKLR